MMLLLGAAVSCGTDELSACFEGTGASAECSYKFFDDADLSNRNLQGIDLSHSHLTNMNLSGANL